MGLDYSQIRGLRKGSGSKSTPQSFESASADFEASKANPPSSAWDGGGNNSFGDLSEGRNDRLQQGGGMNLGPNQAAVQGEMNNGIMGSGSGALGSEGEGEKKPEFIDYLKEIGEAGNGGIPNPTTTSSGGQGSTFVKNWGDPKLGCSMTGGGGEGGGGGM